MTIRLVLVDDHFVVRTGLRMLLESEADVEIVGEAGAAREAIALIGELKPEVVLMDIGMHQDVAIVALTIHEDEQYFFRMLEAGASGYVPKRAAPEELLTAIRAAAVGEVYLYPSLAKLLVRDFLAHEPPARSTPALDGLTSREQEVLAYLAEGASNDEIAQKLTISPKTVARHRENIMSKLNLHTRAELVKYAIRKGIIQP